MGKLLYLYSGDVDTVIEAFKGSPYAITKDDKHTAKLEWSDYLQRTAIKTIQGLTSTAASDDEKYNKKFAKGAIEIQETLKMLQPHINYTCDDKGNGELFADVFYSVARFNVTANEWFVYDGKIYNDLHSAEYSGNTIELVAAVLNGMYKQAMKNKVVRENPVASASLPKKKRPEEPRVMTLEEQDLFVRFSKESNMHDMFRTGLYTGLRSGELRGLEWKNVDFDNKIIRVRKTLLFINNEYILDDPKTESSNRDVPMVDSLCLLLKKHMINQNTKKLMMGDKWRPKQGLEDLVFTTETGYPINRDILKIEVNRIVAMINETGIRFKHITPHAFRHTMACRSIERGMDY